MFDSAETSPRKTAVLADDEAAVRAFVSAVLRRGGFDVLEAPDGMDALALIKKMRGRVDILVTDIKMPRMTGTELVSVVRLEFPHIPVVFMSGEKMPEALHDPRVPIAFVPKPFAPQAMLSAVQSVSPPVSCAGGAVATPNGAGRRA